MKKGINQLKVGAVLSYSQMTINILINLVYTPVMIKLLGKSEYGLYTIVSSTLATLSILNLGFETGYLKYYSVYKAQDEQDKIEKLNGLYILVFSVLGLIALACGLFLTCNLQLVFKNGLTENEYNTAKILFFLLSVDTAISFPASVPSTIISAHERFIVLKLVSLIKTIIGPMITLPLLLSGHGSIALVLTLVICNIVCEISYFAYVKFYMKEVFVFSEFEKGLLKSIFSFTVFVAMTTIIDQINTNVDKILLGRFWGTAETAVYSVGFLLCHCYTIFSRSISSVFSPRIHEIVNRTNGDDTAQKKELSELFIRVGRVQFLILALVCSGVIIFGRYFISNIWGLEGYDDAYYVALLLIIPITIPLIQNLGIEIQRAQSKHKFRAVAYLIMAFINLGLSIILCQKYGPVGCAFGTTVSYIVANGIVMNIYYYRRCNLEIIDFWKNILMLLKGMLIPFTLGGIFMILFEIRTPLEFVISVVIYSFVFFTAVWFFSMNSYEKNLITQPVRKLVEKCRNK